MVVFTTAWGVAFVHSRRLGLGTGHDGYGLMLGGLATTSLVLPFTLFVGALGVVGAGLVFLGMAIARPVAPGCRGRPFSSLAFRTGCTTSPSSLPSASTAGSRGVTQSRPGRSARSAWQLRCSFAPRAPTSTVRHPDERTELYTELPTVALDDVVHQRTRLGILVVLAEAGRAEFTYLKRRLHLSDGNLNRHLDVLIRAGFIEASKDSGSAGAAHGFA